MKRLAAIGVAVGLLACASWAQAVTLVAPDGTAAQPFQRWAERAKAPAPPGTLTIYDLPCPVDGTEYLACVMPGGRVIYAQGVDLVPRLFYHELGHAFDDLVLSDAYRAGFEKIMRYPRADWERSNVGHYTTYAIASPREQFAEGYSLCAAGIRGGRTWYGYGYHPRARQQRRVCALIRRASAAYLKNE